MSQEQLWTKNPSVLFMPGSFQRFVPTKDMDIPTSLNAIVRFTIYFSILLYAGTSKKEYLWSIPFVLLSTMIFAYLFPTQRELVETFTLLNSAPSLIPEKVYTMPTPDNPFMNPLLTEIQDNPNRPDAAPITSKQTKKEIVEAFVETSDMYMDTSDRFDQAQAMRTFHTLQSGTIPSDQDGFLKFLSKEQDAPDTSSTFLSRNAKLKSETYVQAQGSLGSLPNSISKLTGTSPSSSKKLSASSTT